MTRQLGGVDDGQERGQFRARLVVEHRRRQHRPPVFRQILGFDNLIEHMFGSYETAMTETTPLKPISEKI
jgi:hypothetical protein